MNAGSDAAPPHAGDAVAHHAFDTAGSASAPAFTTYGATVGENVPIIVHCHLRWDFVWQRPQQILSRLARRHAILFVEDAILGDGPARLEITEPQRNLWRVVPFLPADAGDVDRQGALVKPMLLEAIARDPRLHGRFDRPVQWFYSPMTAPVFLGAFDTSAVIYDCMDELANFRFAPPDIADREARLLREAGLVYTGGYQLYEAKRARHARVRFHGCGVDTAHFETALDPSLQVHEGVRDLPKPVLGYVGVIDERLDYELIAALADAFPQGSVVMAGPLAKVAKEDLPVRDNLHWLGQQQYARLPSIVKGFDVCLMPFALNDATRFINPTKTLEYLATGKPVVSTPVADVVRNFGDVVRIADGPEAFVAATAAVLATPDPAYRQRGLERAAANSWETTVACMRDELLEVLS